MPSTRLHTLYAAQALLLLSLSMVGVHAQGSIDQMTYVGCFSSSQPLTDEGSDQFQTTGNCRPICQGQNAAVFGLSDGSNCWCGSQLPAASSKVSDSSCDVVCNGYGEMFCGGNGFWSVYTVEEGASVSNYGGSSSNSGSSASDDSSTGKPSPTSNGNNGNQQTTAAPSVITSIAPGQTIVKTVPASEASSSAESPEKSSGGGGSSVAPIAAGVVVGVVALAAIAGGLFWFIRRKKKQAAEDEYKRSNQVSDFMRGGHEGKPPATGYSQMSDSRLDPEAGQRRDSQGSIADNQDYSRRILRVANPDGN